MTGLKWRLITVITVVVMGIVSLLPNFVNVGDNWWFSREKIKYGLDIQGGLHLVMGVDVHAVMSEKLLRTGDTLKELLTKEGVVVSDYKVTKEGSYDFLTLTLNNSGDVQKAMNKVDSDYSILQEMGRTENTLTLRFLDTHIAETKKSTVEQAIETIRNRIDEFGVSEPSITAQGEDRILVQLPGLKESAKAKELINRTARLEFMIVSEKHSQAEVAGWVEEAEKAGNYTLKDMKYSDYVKRINEDLKAKLPERTKVLFQKAENVEKMELGKIPYLLETAQAMGGDAVKDAFVTPGEFNEPEVAMNFNTAGANQFADITGKNVNRMMAIILDDTVYSAPNIKQRIAGGSARITLGGGRDYNAILSEAKLIAMALRAGALPARLEELEERTVGPSLGADSIARAQKAAMVGSVLVLLFMIIYYKVFGVVANIALMMNVLLVYAVLTALEATLTLPGIAGIALTIGMAVDANVIINERIKEELRKGASLMSAIKEGYDKAFSAIFDSNITTAATAIVLMYFGTGPVRGFAVTLLIGIVTTMFTAVFASHTILDLFAGKMKMKKISI